MRSAVMTATMRQLIVVTSTHLAALSMGGFIAYPTQVLKQLKSNDTDIHLDLNSSSWIGAMQGVAGIPAIFLPVFMQWKGRKLGYIIACTFVLAGWTVPLFANSTALLLISEVFQGLATNSLLPISCLIMSEMLSSKFRLVSMQFFGLSMSVGLIIVGVSGRFIHFKTFSVFMIVPIIISILISLSWPESPPWLACRGEFEKCREAFIWLRGTDETSMAELNQLIAAQTERLSMQKSKKLNITLKNFWEQITSRDCYMPSLHMFILMDMLYWSGSDVILVYFLELVEKSSHNETAVYYAGILLYTIVLVGCLITNFTVRICKNKTVLLCSTLGVILCLICACTVSYLQSIGLLANDSLACMYCLIGYMTFNSLGLNALVFYISAELMPVKHRNIVGALYIIINCGLYTMTLKLSPYLIQLIEMWGMFAIFIINAIITAAIVWRYIPETKGRTLQELEDFYINGRFIEMNIAKEETCLQSNTDDLL